MLLKEKKGIPLAEGVVQHPDPVYKLEWVQQLCPHGVTLPDE